MADIKALEQTVKALVSKIDAATTEIDHLHDSLEARGVNSRRVADSIHGRVFALPVDSQHKAKQLQISSCANPHMRAFHASWFGFFSTFFSTFAAAPLAVYLKKDTTLGLTREQLQYGNLASVTANIICRFLMGIVCDKMGARKGLVFLLLFCVLGLVPMMFVTNASGFIACRAIIGVGLASFVACQVWCTQQFSPSIVGTANATSGGWGNLGGGMTNLLMPFIFLGFMAATGEDEDRSWRLCFLVPLGLHLASSALVMTGRDLPDGNFKELEISGAKQKSDSSVVAKVGASNINAWILTIVYAMSFGVELTVTNVASQYFHDYHGTTPAMSGVIAATFGLMNLFARSLGGLTSDAANKRFGMRGRIWALWIFQTIEGIFCVLIGVITLSSTAPSLAPDAAQTTGYVSTSDGWLPFTGPNITATVELCGVEQIKITDVMRSDVDAIHSDLEDLKVLTIMSDPLGAGADCISHSGTLGTSILVFILFSLAVQMAEGLCYGIVPSVSKPALGVVSGMVGAGGNAGSLLTNAAFFLGGARKDQAFINMGIMIIVVTGLMFGVYFPEHGGMIVPKGALKSYDPQIIKPPTGYRGADSMDFANAEKGKQLSSTSSSTTSSPATTDVHLTPLTTGVSV